jgi:hypothetical protein
VATSRRDAGSGPATARLADRAAAPGGEAAAGSGPSAGAGGKPAAAGSNDAAGGDQAAVQDQGRVPGRAAGQARAGRSKVTAKNRAAASPDKLAQPAGGQAKSPGSKPPGSMSAGSKPPGSKPPGSKPPGSKPPGSKPPGTKSPGGKPPGSKSPGSKPPGSKSPGSKLPASKAGHKTSGKSGGQKGAVPVPVPAVPGDADRERPRMPPVRLAPRDELAAAARVAPLVRAAADLSRWADKHQLARPGAGGLAGAMSAAAAGEASADLELTANEVDAAWRVLVAIGLLDDDRPDISHWDDSEVLGAWDSALEAILDAEDLDGLATALYTVGTPVRIDALFEAYTAAAGTPRPERDSSAPGPRPGDGPHRPPDEDEAAALSRALETLADLGVVELGTEEAAGGLTVTLSPLGVWGVHRRLRSEGWHVPVLGSADRNGAVGLLMTLASCDTEDGEAQIGTWLADRTPAAAARELIQAAAGGSPGLRGAAFAVLERIGDAATAEIRAALDDPLLRAHAAVWLHEHDEEADLRPADRTWLLVDLGAGLLEEADPRDVVAELLPEVPPRAQAEIVAGLWQVDHPGVIDLLTALSEHHPDPTVARAARKAAFKARSPGSSGPGSRD